MARFTSIGIPRKAFLASAAEETRKPEDDDTRSSRPAAVDESEKPQLKKRKRRGTRGKELKGFDEEVSSKQIKQWGREAGIAKRTKLSESRRTKLSESRHIKRISDRHVATTCFACRSIGHAARDCPNVLLAQNGGEGSTELRIGETDRKRDGNENVGMKRKFGKKGGDVIGGRCYRCNAMDHSLSGCSEPIDAINPTPYATCFICLGSGHLSSLCASNQGRGIYVNGGNCKLCSSTGHRAKDCPENSAQMGVEVMERPGAGKREVILGNGTGGGADEDDFMVTSRLLARETGGERVGKGKRKKHPPSKNGERPGRPIQLVEDSYSAVNRSEGTVVLPDLKAAPSVRQAETKSKPKVINF